MKTRTPWIALTSAAVVIARDDIDTDQIIPARFLTTTQRAGLGRHAFADWRYHADGTPRADFPLNDVHAVGRGVLVAGENFGCGSSREHAPWALLDAGFHAVVAASFADIFRSNANRNGLLTVAIGDTLLALQQFLASTPNAPVAIDLATQTLSWGTNLTTSFEVDAFTKRALLTGLDELGMLIDELPAIVHWELERDRAVVSA